MKDQWYLIMIISIIVFAGGLVLASGCMTPADVSSSTPTPTSTETSIQPTPTLRPATSDDLPNFDYADVPAISSGDTNWMTTNASYVARIALRDEAARAMYLGGGTVEGVLLSCHPTPFPSSGSGCAPALRIVNKTMTVDFQVNETEGRVISTVTEK